MNTCAWLEQSEADVPPSTDWLNEREISRLASMRFPKRRAEWLLGRWTAKQTIAAFLKLPIENDHFSIFEIRSAASGAPEVFMDDAPLGVSISISHRKGVAACAITLANTTLGCDLETIEPRSRDFVADYFTSDEQQLVMQAPGWFRPTLVTLIWSAKESALKVLKEGLRLQTQSVTVRPIISTPSTWLPIQVDSVEGKVFHGWWRSSHNLVRTVVSSEPLSKPVDLSFAEAEVLTAEAVQ